MANNKFKWKKAVETYDLVVCGGGLAGFCAAVSAARNGVNTCIIQDRPVFGGNSSSEIRVKPHGADRHHNYGRETGILMELMVEERARNHVEIFGDNGWLNSVWDMVLYDLAVKTPNLTFKLNTSVFEVILDGERHLAAVLAKVEHAETILEVRGKIFIDCTGDGLVAAQAGCEWRLGEESRAEFNEPHAPSKASANTMGNSLHFCARDMGRPVPFTPPEWATRYDDASYFYENGRTPYTPKGGFWWLEIGTPWHTIYDNEEIRHELTCHLLGVWDWIKNKDPRLKEQAANYAIDWIGQVPGKRESRRIMGLYLMKEQDVVNKVAFPDEIAYGGFYIDLHTIGGMRAATSEPVNATQRGDDINEKSDAAVSTYVGPYGIPLRILISKDIDNLMMAGRNVSTTHAAFGTLRVMGTTSLMGQAAGTAAAVAIRHNAPIAEIPEKWINEVQQTLLKDGCFLPNFKNEDPFDLAKTAKPSAGSSARLSGAGPFDKNWMNEWCSWLTGSPYLLKERMGQFIAVGGEQLENVSVCLSNLSGQTQTVRATLHAADHIWDYDCSENKPALRDLTLVVQPGDYQWMDIPVNLDKNSGFPAYTYLRLDLHKNPQVAWYEAGTFLPYHPCAYEVSTGKMRKYKRGASMSFRVQPQQDVYNPNNVLSGVIKPHRFTNVWKSDPTRSLPEWFQLEWDQPVKIGKIILTFPGYQTFEYREYPPFFKDPETAKDYCISAWVDGKWIEIVSIKGNYAYRPIHTLAEQVDTQKIRITFFNTNGVESAGLYEVRCYEQ